MIPLVSDIQIDDGYIRLEVGLGSGGQFASFVPLFPPALKCCEDLYKISYDFRYFGVSLVEPVADRFNLSHTFGVGPHSFCIRTCVGTYLKWSK